MNKTRLTVLCRADSVGGGRPARQARVRDALAGGTPAPHRIRASHWLVLLACSLGLLSAADARAQDANPPEIVDLRVGFSGQFKVGLWTPVEVTIRGGATSVTGQLELTVADGDGAASTVVSQRVQLLPGVRTPVLMYVKFGDAYGEMKAVFRVDRRRVIDRTFRNDRDVEGLELPIGLATSDTLLVSVGGSLGIEREQSEPSYQAARMVVARVDDVTQLPHHWFGYEGVDALILSTSRPEIYGKLAENSAELAAIDGWVRRGGKLVVFAGAQAPVVLSSGAALARFAPGKFEQSTTLRRASALESFSGVSVPIAHAGDAQFGLQVPKFQSVTGIVEAAEGDLPLVVRSPRAFGQIVFAAVDQDRPPLVDWKGRDALVRKLLDLPQQKDATEQALSIQARNYGISDLAGQLRGALDNFGIDPISFFQVALLIFVYILLIGPGDYFFVKKVLKRMEWTWATFPTIVAVVSLGAYGLAYWSKGADLRLNQAEIVDLDVESGLVRGTSWLNVFSPRTASYDVSVARRPPEDAKAENPATAQPPPTPEPEDWQVLMSWMGDPGTGWGGMDRRQQQPSLFGRAYLFTPALDAMLDVPIQVWSTKTFTGRYSFTTKSPIAAKLSMGLDQVPEGTLKSELPFTLHQCTLLSGRWAYDLGDLKPGETATLIAGKHRDLEHVLKDFRLVRDEKNNTYMKSAPFQPDNQDVLQILQKMMFYKKAGGRESLQLGDGYQRFVDMSALLDLDRAILVGLADRPASQLVDNGEPLIEPGDEHWQHWTFYRIVFPIQSTKSGGRPAKE